MKEKNVDVMGIQKRSSWVNLEFKEDFLEVMVDVLK